MGRTYKNRIVSKAEPTSTSKERRQKKLQVAAYTRVFADSNAQENSLKNQREHYNTIISANPNWKYVGLYADTGTRNRREFNRMLEDCKAGKIDLIVVKDVTRFARNATDCLKTVEFLQTLDPPVGIYFENNNLNTLDVDNKLSLMIFAMIEEWESEVKSKFTKSEANVRAGKKGITS